MESESVTEKIVIVKYTATVDYTELILNSYWQNRGKIQ